MIYDIMLQYNLIHIITIITYKTWAARGGKSTLFAYNLAAAGHENGNHYSVVCVKI